MKIPEFEIIHPPTSPKFPKFINDWQEAQETKFVKTIENTMPIGMERKDIVPKLTQLVTDYEMKYIFYLPENNDYCSWNWLILCILGEREKEFIWIFDNQHAMEGLIKAETYMSNKLKESR